MPHVFQRSRYLLTLLLVTLLLITGCANQPLPTQKNGKIDEQKKIVHDNCFQSIYGETPDYTFAHQLCNQAAQLDLASAQTLLGELYFFGLGTNQHYQHAFALYQKAARQGHPHAQFMLYHMYIQGLGVDAFPTQAEIWLQKSASSGHPQALKIISSR